MWVILQFCSGLILLILGAELLVRGASHLAALLGISPLVIGLTVVALGTSAPEFAISINASLSGQAELALGNVIGSNIFNVLFILGLSAMIAPLLVSAQLVRLDVPLVIFASVLVLLLSLDQNLGHIDGMVLFSCLIAYLVLLIRLSRKEILTANEQIEFTEKPEKDSAKSLLTNAFLVVGGLLLLILGARWLVTSAVSIAEYFGVSQLVIGLTIIAIGTSLPEVVTSILAALRGQRDIAIGSVVGSNLFNLLGVLGLTAMIAPGGIYVSQAVIGFDLPIMLVVAFACLPIFFTGGQISRWEGAVLFAYYVAYSLYLFFAAAHHDALPLFSNVMLYFAIPLTAITLIILSLTALQNRNSPPHVR